MASICTSGMELPEKEKPMYNWEFPYPHKVSADIAARVCEELEESSSLTEKNLVEVSRPEEAPLHPEFNWGDGVIEGMMAELYRIWQARHIISDITIKRYGKEPVRRFIYIEMVSGYISIEKILKVTFVKKKLLDQALKDLKAFKKKYEILEELSEVFEKIESLEKEIA